MYSFRYKALDWLKTHPIETEASYPYQSGGGSNYGCQSSSGTAAGVSVTGRIMVPSTEEDIMRALVAHGPLSILVDAMTQLWWPYKGGILSGCCNKEVDHAVLLVGYGTDTTAGPYWLVKNSWGASWGEKGYLRLQRGNDSCGITTQAVAAIVTSGPSPGPSPGPTPTPGPTPGPSPSTCPSDATETTDGATRSCMWANGVKGVKLPPRVGEYCEYIASGYIGYYWPKSAGGQSQYPCSSSAFASSSAEDWFCEIRSGTHGVVIPSNAKANCSAIATQGVFGYSWVA
jgi:hypothetical protein